MSPPANSVRHRVPGRTPEPARTKAPGWRMRQALDSKADPSRSFSPSRTGFRPLAPPTGLEPVPAWAPLSGKLPCQSALTRGNAEHYRSYVLTRRGRKPQNWTLEGCTEAARGSEMRGRRRGWGKIERMRSGRYRATYVGPDLDRHLALGTFENKASAE